MPTTIAIATCAVHLPLVLPIENIDGKIPIGYVMLKWDVKTVRYSVRNELISGYSVRYQNSISNRQQIN